MCDAIKQTCEKSYSFSPFWEGSILRKQARDQLCAICNTLQIYRFSPEMKQQLKDQNYKNQEIAEFERQSMIMQNGFRSAFLQKIAGQIEASKDNDTPPPTIQQIKQDFDQEEKNIYKEFMDDFAITLTIKSHMYNAVHQNMVKNIGPNYVSAGPGSMRY